MVESHADILFLGCVDSDNGVCGARNGVAQVAAVDLGERKLIFLAEVEEEACEELVGVGSPEVDIASGVSALSFGYIDLEIGEIVGRERTIVGECAHSVDTSGTSDEYLGIVFGVEIEQDRSGNHVALKTEGTGHAGFLVDSHERFERTVHRVWIGHYGERRSHTYSVVGSERGAFGTHPVAVDHSGDGSVVEVERLVVALTHHIHVALEYHRRSILMTRSGGRRDDHVAHLVGLGLKIVLLGEIEQIAAYFLLLLGRTGHLRDLIEDFKDPFGFEFFNCHVADCLLWV